MLSEGSVKALAGTARGSRSDELPPYGPEWYGLLTAVQAGGPHTPVCPKAMVVHMPRAIKPAEPAWDVLTRRTYCGIDPFT